MAWRLDNEKQVLARVADGGHPVVVIPGVVYGKGSALITQFLVEPGRDRHVVHYIGDGANHWSLVHVDDIAELYVLALSAPAGSVYAGVTETGVTGRTASVSLEQARLEMGPIADGFALDQQVDSARARHELGWNPPTREPLAELMLPAETATARPGR